MNRMFKAFGIVAFGLALTVAFGMPVYADTISYSINTPNSAISAYPGPYVSLIVNRTDTTHATLTYTSLNSAGNTYTYTMGAQGTVGANINATSFTVGTITETDPDPGANLGANPPGFAGSSNEDGWGSFNLTIDNFDGFTYRSTSVSFTVTNTSGTWATANDVLKANSGGSIAASHIFVVDGPATGAACPSDAACATGFAATSGGTIPPQPVPEPSSVLSLGTGLVGMVTLLRKRSKA